MSFYKEVPGRQTTLESTLKFDTEPKAGSTNPVTSDGVKNAIYGAVGDAAEALQEQIDEIAEKAGSGYIPNGEATVATLNALSGQENGELYTMTDAGTLTLGSLAVVAGDTVAWDDANSVWYKAMNYAPAQYGTDQVKNLPTTITAFRTGDVIPVDGPSGTAKMSKDDLLAVTAQNALAGNVAPEFVPNETNAIAGLPYTYGGKLYMAKENYNGVWDASKFTLVSFSEYYDVNKKIVESIIYGISDKYAFDGKVKNTNVFSVGDGSHILVPMSGDTDITLIKRDNYAVQLFWLREYTPVRADNFTPIFCEGHTSRESLDSGTYTSPSDCKYVAIASTTKIGSDFINILPTSIVVDGFDYITGQSKSIGVLNQKATGLRADADETSLELGYLYGSGGKTVITVLQGSFTYPSSAITCHTDPVELKGAKVAVIDITRPIASGLVYHYGFRTYRRDAEDPDTLIVLRDVAANVNKDDNNINLNENEELIAFTIVTYKASDSSYPNLSAASFEGSVTCISLNFENKDNTNELVMRETGIKIVSMQQGSFMNPSSSSTCQTAPIDIMGATSLSFKTTRPIASGLVYHYGFRTYRRDAEDPDTLIVVRDIKAVTNKTNNKISINAGEAFVAVNIATYRSSDGTVPALSAASFYSYDNYFKLENAETSETAYTRNIDKTGVLLQSCRYKFKSLNGKDLQLALLGDQHGDGIAVSNAVDILNGFGSIDAMLNVGDCSDSFASSFSEDYFSILAKSKKPVYHTLGNHDVGYGPLVGKAGSNQQVYNKWIAPLIEKGWIASGEYEIGKSYYYHDFGGNAKIRLIVLNAYDDDNELYEGVWKGIAYDSTLDAIGGDGTSYVVGDKVNVPGFTEYSFECVSDVTIDSSTTAPTRPSYMFMRGINVIRQSQAQWFLDTLASTPENYGVVVALHLVPSRNCVIDHVKGANFCQDISKTADNFGAYGMRTDFLSDAINAFVNGSNYSETVEFRTYRGFDGQTHEYAQSYSISKDFSTKNAGVKFHCFVCGHTHYDLVWKHGTYLQYTINPLAANTDYARNHVFGNYPEPPTDIVRTDFNGFAKDSLTIASFNVDQHKVGLVKVGVNITVDAVKRDVVLLTLDS